MAEAPLVHVVDDDASVRDSLALLLESAGFSVRSYDSAAAFLQAASDRTAGCVLTDVQMPELNGLELQRRMGELGIRLPVIVMTGHGDVPLAVGAMKAGVRDFIEKPYDDETMLGAIRTALALEGRSQAHAEERAELARRVESLSPRERQVLDGLVAGKANKVIAYDLDISPRTVEIYRAHVMTKMQAQSLSEVVRMALVAGLS